MTDGLSEIALEESSLCEGCGCRRGGCRCGMKCECQCHKTSASEYLGAIQRVGYAKARYCSACGSAELEEFCNDCGSCGPFLDENPHYGPGNPDWERDRFREGFRLP